jgi:hypothetical protein
MGEMVKVAQNNLQVRKFAGWEGGLPPLKMERRPPSNLTTQFQ